MKKLFLKFTAIAVVLIPFIASAGTVSVNKNPSNSATATALAANGANCSAGAFPAGVDASGAVESCSTATYPLTTTANQILYSSSTSVVGQITTANNGVLTTNGSSVPSLTTVASNCTPTVTLVGGAGNTTPVYTTNACRQVRFGPMTLIDVFLNLDGGNEGAGTGVMTVALPTTANASSPAGVFPCGEFLNSTTSDIVLCTINAGAATVSLSKYTTLGTLVTFQGVDQNSTTRDVRLHFFYEN